jgi:hypothetical protein
VIGIEPTVNLVAAPTLLMLAALALLEVHLTWLVRLSMLLSAYISVARNGLVAMAAIDGFTGVMLIVISDRKELALLAA